MALVWFRPSRFRRLPSLPRLTCTLRGGFSGPCRADEPLVVSQQRARVTCLLLKKRPMTLHSACTPGRAGGAVCSIEGRGHQVLVEGVGQQFLLCGPQSELGLAGFRASQERR